MNEQEKLHKCPRETDPWSNYRDCCETFSDEDLWFNLAGKAMEMIDREQISQAIVEAFKVLKYPEPSVEYQNTLEQLYALRHLEFYTIRE